MRSVRADGVRKRFGEIPALAGVDFFCERGEVIVVLGPSGSGKSTLLRVVAGLEEPDEGDVLFDGEPQVGIPPHLRDVAIVFQNYALYPHLTVRQNISLGLKHGLKLSSTEIRDRVERVLSRLQIEELIDRRPRAMSGGQRQRVALARALARQSGIVLLDEPLSGLDAQLKQQLRVELSTILRESGATTIHVTHDQLDALSMADRVAIMREGAVEQIGSPSQLYDRPRTAFVAKFLGSPAMNLLKVTRERGGDGRAFRTAFGRHRAQAEVSAIGIRPEQASLTSSGPLVCEGRVATVELTGADSVVHLYVGDELLAVRCPNGQALRPSSVVPISAHPDDIHVFGSGMQERIGSVAEVFPLLESGSRLSSTN